MTCLLLLLAATDGKAQLGLGGLCRVVTGTLGGDKVAVKLLYPAHVLGPALAEHGATTLAQEVDALLHCSHPNIVRLLGAGLSPPQPFLVLEFMPLSLHDLIYDLRQPLPLDKVRGMGAGVYRMV